LIADGRDELRRRDTNYLFALIRLIRAIDPTYPLTNKHGFRSSSTQSSALSASFRDHPRTTLETV